MKQINLVYSGIRLTPGIRNLIRAMGLGLDLAIVFTFKEGEENYILAENTGSTMTVEKGFFGRIWELVCSHELKNNSEEADKLLSFYAFLGNISQKDRLPLLKDELFELLEYTAEYLCDYRKIDAKVPERWKEFRNLWQRCFGELVDFHVRRTSRLNKINLSEITVYEEIFQSSKEGVPSIDNAVHTFLDTLPDDAEKILDIGAGPGYVNRNIPADYQVLAMDLDEAVLNGNIRPTCIGDVTDIPLDDHAVDLVMACDLLEHVPEELFPKALEEMKRVAGKYLYLQVPYHENLRDSMAKCSKCGNVWHVNYHKRSFTCSQLAGVLGEGWKISRINFTGEISSYYRDYKNSRVLEDLGIDYRIVEGWKCPICGGDSHSVYSNEYWLINDICAEQNVFQEPLPCYSELGILFCREEQTYAGDLEENWSNFKKFSMNTMNLDLTREVTETHVFSKHELFPTYIVSGLRVSRNKMGYLFEPLAEIEAPWVSFLFPGKVYGARFVGEIVEPAAVSISALDLCGQEFVIEEIELEKGVFEHSVQIDRRIAADHGMVKLYIKKGALYLQRIEGDGHGKEYMRYQSVKPCSHLKKRKGNILFSWLVPKNGFLDMTDNMELWEKDIDSGNTEAPKSFQTILKYLSDMRKAVTEFYYEKKQLEAKSQQILSVSSEDQVPGQMDHIEKSVRVEEMWEELKREKQNWKFQVSMLEELLSEKEELIEKQKAMIYHLEGSLMVRQNKTLLRIKNKAYGMAGKGIRFSKRVVREIPFLYHILVKLGVKKRYNQIKGKIKSGESYE